MECLIDSDVLIDLLDRGKDLPAGVDILQSSISVITYFEVLYGAEKREKAKLLEAFLTDFGVKVIELSRSTIDLAVDARIALESKGQKLDVMDLLIAATAVNEGLVLVTNNKRHFNRVSGLKLL